MIKTKHVAITVDTGFSGGYYNEVVEVVYLADDDPIKEEENFHRAVGEIEREIILENICSEYTVIESSEAAERLHNTYWGDPSNLEATLEEIMQDIEEDTDEPI
jgi:hypothetical protein